MNRISNTSRVMMGICIVSIIMVQQSESTFSSSFVSRIMIGKEDQRLNHLTREGLHGNFSITTIKTGQRIRNYATYLQLFQAVQKDTMDRGIEGL